MNQPVMIAGAGPVGLFLAAELALAGVPVVILEQAEDPASPLKRLPFGRRGLWTTTLEALYRRGLLDVLVEALGDQSTGPADAHWARGSRRPGGHFAGIPVFDDGSESRPWRLAGPAGDSLMIDTLTLEQVLTRRAEELGVEIRRGLGVTAVETSESGVRVRAGSLAFETPWLIGCDGGRSTVRKSAGFQFQGTEPEFTGYSVLVDLDDPEGLPQGRHYTPAGMFTYGHAEGRPAALSMAEFDGGVYHRAQPVTREHVQAVLRRVTGSQLVVKTLHQSTTFTDRAFQVSSYRQGRVLLAGDAAHVHSPLGGQGLNLAIGDAMNLGWKLAAVCKGKADAGLLDSYEQERIPVGAAVLDWSRAQVALMRPSRASRALEAILRDLIATPDGAAYFADRVRGASQRYDLGEEHPLVGRSCPDFELHDGLRLGQHLRSGRGLLLDFEGDPRLAEIASGHPNLDYLPRDAQDRLGLTAMLIRPDGIVAWVAADEPRLEAAARAAERWF
ncbi:MAG: FAD-dependent monooxygenase [Candidatus Eremiobacteraeota bacterium]|nr:FAD-dependent monooxygenase [Candidatus Eremiobacteraeota bacterium]